MTINDLKPGMSCTLLAQKKGLKYENKVTIHKVERDHIVTTAIRVKDKVVTFNGTTNSLIIYNGDNPPQIFQYIVPAIVKDVGGKSFYKIVLKQSRSKEIDRRRAPRYTIGRNINVRADNNEKTYTCNLRDISATGFALMFTGKNIPKDYKNIKTFHITFNDMDLNKSIKVNFNLTGAVKRRKNLDDQQILFGCQFGYSKDVNEYIKTIKRSKAYENK